AVSDSCLRGTRCAVWLTNCPRPAIVKEDYKRPDHYSLRAYGRSTHRLGHRLLDGPPREPAARHRPLRHGRPGRGSHPPRRTRRGVRHGEGDRKSTRLNSSHVSISYAVFCLKKKRQIAKYTEPATPARW